MLNFDERSLHEMRFFGGRIQLYLCMLAVVLCKLTKRLYTLVE